MSKSILNWQDGIARVVNNRGLYAKLLGRFAETEKDCANKIAKALAEGNMEEAGLLTHSLKGTSANLGAEMLSQAALELEMAIKSGGEYAAPLAHVESVLAQTLQEKANFSA